MQQGPEAEGRVHWNQRFVLLLTNHFLKIPMTVHEIGYSTYHPPPSFHWRHWKYSSKKRYMLKWLIKNLVVYECCALWPGLGVIMLFKVRIDGSGSDYNILFLCIAFMTKYIAVYVTPSCSAWVYRGAVWMTLVSALSMNSCCIPVILILLWVKNKAKKLADRRVSVLFIGTTSITAKILSVIHICIRFLT